MTSNPDEGLPILCLDTCAILDVVRDPVREDAHAEDHAASLALNTKDFGGPRGLGIAEDIVEEFEAAGLGYASGMAGAKRLLGL